MDDLSRLDYPALLAHLQPSQAVRVLDDRVKRIGKINTEIAEWMAERRRLEEQYVVGLRKLVGHRVPNSASELGIFQVPWDRIIQSTNHIAHAHQQFAVHLERDVETPMRGLSATREMQHVSQTANSMTALAKELDESQAKVDKLSRKGGKAQKVEEASAKYDAVCQQWEVQGPFAMEALQTLDEIRCNQLRDLLTQYLTHEADKATTVQSDAEQALNVVLELDTATEILNFAQHIGSGKPRLDRPQQTPRPSMGPSMNSATTEDTTREVITTPQPESKLKRLGTMLGRRRQSVHGSFGQVSPQRGLSTRLGSSHGRLSPRTSSHNLSDTQNRLSVLSETPNSPPMSSLLSGPVPEPAARPTTADAWTDATSTGANETPVKSQPHGPLKGTSERTDAMVRSPERDQNEQRGDDTGFSVPAPSNDPISQAQREASEAIANASSESNPFFKLSIQKEPIPEEDPDANQAALSNVASTLTAMGMPTRKSGTVRGRRDVRSTMFATGSEFDNLLPSSPSLSQNGSLAHFPPAARQRLISDTTETGASFDTLSVRSGTSLASVTHFQHPEAFSSDLHASIIEAISATFDGDTVTSVQLNGEVALARGANGGREHIRVRGLPQLEALHPNRMFVHQDGQPGDYIVDTTQLSRMTPIFTYRTVVADSTAAMKHLPFIIKTTWKVRDDKLDLLLQYSHNDKCAGAEEGISLQGVTFFASYVGRAKTAQLKPSGTHLRERHIVYWRLGDLTLKPGSSEKILCRIIGTDGGDGVKPGSVKATWEHAPETGSKLGTDIALSWQVAKGKERSGGEDPFADADIGASSLTDYGGADPTTWSDMECRTKKKTMAGKYETKV